MEINFSALMLAPLIVEAEARNAYKNGAVVGNRKIAPYTDFEINLEGLIGEYAVTKALDLPMNMTRSKSGDHGIDFTLHGKTGQIKTTRTKYLIFCKDNRKMTADLAILVKLRSICRAEIAGWITREEFYRSCTERDFNYGTRDVVTLDALHPIDTLLKEAA